MTNTFTRLYGGFQSMKSNCLLVFFLFFWGGGGGGNFYLFTPRRKTVPMLSPSAACLLNKNSPGSHLLRVLFSRPVWMQKSSKSAWCQRWVCGTDNWREYGFAVHL